MLGCLRMTIEECENAYIRLAETIFKPKRWKYDCFSRGLDFFSASERYDSSKLEDVAKAIIKTRTGSEEAPLLDLNEDAECRVFVTTVQTEDHELLLLRSYENKQEVDKHSKQFRLWEALRATSAATTYFKEYRRGNAGYLDGGLKSNNPIFQVHREARDLWPDREALLISIGTGTKPSVPLRGNLIRMARTLTKLVTETEETWSRFKGTHKNMLEDSHLFRYSVPGLGGVDLGNYKLMGMIRTNTERHLREASTEKYVMTCAGKVVEIETKTYASPRPKKAAPLRVENLSDAEKVTASAAAKADPNADCLRALHATSRDYESQRLGIEKPVPGTCQWFLRHPKFVDWLQGASSPLLWVTANPGCGKSVLSSFLVDALGQKANDSIVCSFFFKAGIDSRRDAHQALCALLHQLFVVVPELTQTAMEDYSCKDTSSFTGDIAALWKVFLEAAGRVGKRTIVCVVDALDECADGSRSRFIDQLVTTFPSQCPQGKDAKLKFLVTSRPWPSIETRFRNLLAIRLSGENEPSALSQDVEKVVEHRVRELKESSVLSAEASSVVAKVLSDGADRTFLWVSLVFDSIERLQSRKLSSIEKSLQSLPSDLDQLYGGAWTSFVDRAASHRLLGIVLAAKRPLKLGELNIALSLADNTTSTAALKHELEPDAEYTVKELGGFFLRIIDSTVFLVHQTARDFLLRSQVDESGKDVTSRIDLGLAEHSLAKTCISYLSLEDLPIRLTLPTDEEERLASNKAFLAKLPPWGRSFYEYASTSWMSHLPGHNVFESKSSIYQSVELICDSSGPYFDGWWFFYVEKRFFIDKEAKYPTGYIGCHAHYSTMRGDHAVTRGLLESGTCEAGQSIANHPDLLSETCRRGHVEQLEWILGSFDHSTLDLHRSLGFAASLGMIEAVQLILTTEVQVNTSKHGSPSKDRPLAEYALHSRPILELLLDRGLLIRGEDIVSAARQGHDESLALIIDRAPRDVDDITAYLRKGLALATENGYPRCRTRILKHLPRSAADDLDLSVGLVPAVERNDHNSVRELLAMGATVNDNEGLMLSCSFGHADTAKALTDGHIYPDEVLGEALMSFYDMYMAPDLKLHCLQAVSRAIECRGALHEGFKFVPKFGLSFEESTELLGLFSAKGVRVARRRFVEATALVIAMDESFGLWLVEATDGLQDDSTFTAKDFFPLACFWGRSSIVRQLITRGADVNRQDDCGMTPLMAAIASGSPDVVELLLRAGAKSDRHCQLGSRSGPVSDVDSELDDLYAQVAKGLCCERLRGTPRSFAQDLGHGDMVELFDMYGSEVERP
ncbi:Ankyrin repeat protein [Colletotrichum higginsianum IMI 349063]|uniref:phospholipase A2 n=1 Tax=Colletotrichum higginsianum (strain IMI 349063) TaxID=759273 RepID=A0A1B7XRH9_COLHI|nr:Ankyrin repeat protein [Colletotrichum higginsianum IMI 349063]OBR02356.1 Ankyrin repeat protein [Colletotrichum higginsianum IMI 349063]